MAYSIAGEGVQLHLWLIGMHLSSNLHEVSLAVTSVVQRAEGEFISNTEHV